MTRLHPVGTYSIQLEGPKDSLEFIRFFMKDKGWTCTGPESMGPLGVSNFYLVFKDLKAFNSDLKESILPFGFKAKILYKGDSTKLVKLIEKGGG